MNTLLLQVNQNDWLFASDKINSVMTIILMVFAGTIIYLYLTNKKVNELEKKISDLEKRGEGK
jgi:cell division protein FtsL